MERLARSRLDLEAFALPLAWLVIAGLFSILRPSTFATLANARTIFGSQSVLVIVALGLTIALVIGDFDLSVGANLGFAGMLSAWLNVDFGWPIWLSVIITLMAGLLIGALNSLLVVGVGVDALVATLGVGTLVTGVTYATTNYLIVSGVDRGLARVVSSRPFGLPLSFFYALLLATGIWWFLRYTATGRRLAFAGGNREAARLSGLAVNHLRSGAFLFCGLCAALAGVVLTGTLGAADPNNGLAFLLPAFAAAFLGSTTIRPGHFNPWGTVVAVYFLVTGITGLQLLGLRQWIQEIFYGASLILAIVLAKVVSQRNIKRA
ncbi:MAG: ABC transporter permease [bacterium]|nr:ABC transporter permease [bacterium]MDE0288587.1 ABC transporter permease [bacterium]MDE0439898.1 ABC transporter permease [bacterium]